MIIKPPFCITPRLLPGIRIGGAWLSVDYAKEQNQQYRTYVYYLDFAGKEFTGTCNSPNYYGLQKGLETLLNFLGVFEIAVRYNKATGHKSEELELFPKELANWAMENNTEIFDLECRLTENQFIEEDHGN